MAPLRCANAPVTAQLFVQLSLRQRCSYHHFSTAVATSPAVATTVPEPSPVFDHFLLPPTRKNVSVRTNRLRPATKSAPFPLVPFAPRAGSGKSNDSKGSRLYMSRSVLRPSAPGSGTAPSPPGVRSRRHFGTTPSKRRTQAIYNPANDEDGNEMLLEITPRAAKRLSDIMTRDSNPRLALRIQVESGGCHGFQYLMSLVTLPDRLPNPPTSAGGEDGPDPGADAAAVRDDDTIFAHIEGDAGGEGGGGDSSSAATAALLETAPKIILDGPSLDLLKGSKVDFTMELIGSQFKIVDNPLATSSCGCGTSFDIKV